MPNRRLTTDELQKANHLLQDIRVLLNGLAGEDFALLFAYRRKIAKELGYDERGKPMMRKVLKLNKMIAQKGLCAECQNELPKRGAELDRINAMDGYTEENTRLVHHECHVKSQEGKGFA
jgi:UTP:GlnB (protein PII) uridylyltransferase